MRADLRDGGTPESVVEDAVLVLSELLSNAYRHARPLERQQVRASWSQGATGETTVSVTDGGGSTRPLPATPSVTARGGRGLALVTALSQEWGVLDTDPSGAVTVWAVLSGSDG